MQRIYLDNAATTALDPEVLEVMMPYLTEKFGNPSSIYSYGRETRLAVENARKSVAKLLHAQPSEIFFTSGGTESSNTAIRAAIRDLGCKQIVSSPIEHHATLHTVECCAGEFEIPLHFVELDKKGHVVEASLRTLLEQAGERCLVSLMHANNEIGNLLKIKNIAAICREYDAIFHCDTVQTVGHYPIHVKEIGAHFITGAGHKFHGPKGIGILYVSDEVQIKPMIHGGGQERNMRAGTENLYGIVGFAKALELSMERYEEDSQAIRGLKEYMMQSLVEAIPGVRFNGDVNGSSLYTVLNVGFPKTEKSEMLLYSLDMAGICVSGGSACSSGANHTSHVISNICPEADFVPVRFSFCRHNTRAEIDTVVEKLKMLI